MAILRILSIFFVAATFIPLVKLDYWWIRIFDYPRIQKLAIVLILALCWLLWMGGQSLEPPVWILVLLGCGGYLAFKVLPFSVFGKKMIRRVPYDEHHGIHLLICNVYQYNRQYGKLLRLATHENPDVIFLVETDAAWEKGISKLEGKFPFQVKVPLDNTYGMLLYSKLPIVRQVIQHLIDPDIPSVEVDLKLRSGRLVTLYGIHPTPPVPGHNSTSTDRDAEILIVGKKAKSNPLPSLVVGDLNDVAWSCTTELFLKISEMADPRRGRGTFNTFHAKVPLFRWPLDHVFLSKHFGLADMKVLHGIGSDHFPIRLKAVLTAKNTTDTMTAEPEEKAEANEKIRNGLEQE